MATPAERAKKYRELKKMGFVRPICGICSKTRLTGAKSLETGICGYCRNRSGVNERVKKYQAKNKQIEA